MAPHEEHKTFLLSKKYIRATGYSLQGFPNASKLIRHRDKLQSRNSVHLSKLSVVIEFVPISEYIGAYSVPSPNYRESSRVTVIRVTNHESKLEELFF